MKKLLFLLLSIAVVTSCSKDDLFVTNTEPLVLKTTNNFCGVNWACPGDNFQSGNLYLSGLSSSDNYSSAAAVADRVVGQFVSKLGANSVRMPINETSVNGSYWNTYTGAIDKALSYGKVILCYWSWTHGVPTNMNDWWNMWSKVIDKYGGNSNCYFEPFNEPNMYNNTDLCNLYNEFVNVRFTSIPKNRFILDGAGLAQNVPAVGDDSRLSSCLLAVHDYSFFAYLNSESAWQDHIRSYVGNYASRTVCTEWGYPNSPGSKNGIYYGYIDYNATSGTGGGDYFYYYARGISKQLRSWNMGSFYWPGLRDGDWYSMTNRSGSGSNIDLTIPNESGLYWLRYSWGLEDGDCFPTTITPYIQVADGSWQQTASVTVDPGVKVKFGPQPVSGGSWSWSGGGTSGSSREQTVYPTNSFTATATYTNSCGTQSMQNFNVTVNGSDGTENIRLRNVATSLYIDGMGRTSNGSNCGQYSSSGNNNQQWIIEAEGSYVKIKNSATGLYLDGMGRTSDGSITGQWSNSSSYNQQWTQETSGSYIKFKNRATELYLDGMGRTSDGSDLSQWSSSGSNTQLWQMD
jgi:hypothetical protein